MVRPIQYFDSKHMKVEFEVAGKEDLLVKSLLLIHTHLFNGPCTDYPSDERNKIRLDTLPKTKSYVALTSL